MAEDAATSADETQVTFNIKAANDQKFVLTVPSSTTVADLKTKLSTSEYADIPADRQRLIYSGRVLKNPDTLASVKIKDGHTVHLVKGAASNVRQNPAGGAAGSATGGAAPADNIPTNMNSGTLNNPLAGLTGARYAGFHGLPGMDTFGPDGGMGPPPNPDALLEMMDNPMFLSQMNEAMNNPQVIEMMTQNPMVRNNPMIAEMLRNPDTRRMLFSPEMMRMQLEMQRSMGGNRGGSSFPAPGVTDNTPQAGAGATGTGTAGAQQNPGAPADPFASLFGPGAGAGGAAGANPFASLFAPGANPFAPPPQNNSNTTGTDSNTSNTNATRETPGAEGTPNPASLPPNPFGNLFGGAQPGQQANPLADMTRNLMQNPEAMRQAMQMMGMMNGGGAGGAGANPFAAFGQPPSNSDPATGTPGSNSPAPNPLAALFGPGAFGPAGGFGTPPPADNRPPEEVYEVQLRQLNEMGFYEFDRNVSALRRSGGNVQGAIEYLLSGDA